MPGLAALLGQDRAREVVRRALASDRVPHAYLFDGPAGVGKKTAALALAQALNCEREPGAARCECGPCQKIIASLHPDISVTSPGGAGGFIVIDQIRDLLASLAFPPHEGKARVIVVEDAERMHPSAQNAFLKTLEEPPARTHIVLTSTAPERLLVTIRSRCQRVRFAPLPADAVAAILRMSGVDAAAAETAALLSGGSLERGAALADGERLEHRWQAARRMAQAARAGALKNAVQAAQAAAEDKEEIVPTLDLLAHFYRDAAATAAGAELPRSPLPGWIDELEAERSQGTALLARRAALVLDTQTAILGFASAPLQLEALVVGLREG